MGVSCALREHMCLTWPGKRSSTTANSTCASLRNVVGHRAPSPSSRASIKSTCSVGLWEARVHMRGMLGDSGRQRDRSEVHSQGNRFNRIREQVQRGGT